MTHSSGGPCGGSAVAMGGCAEDRNALIDGDDDGGAAKASRDARSMASLVKVEVITMDCGVREDQPFAADIYYGCMVLDRLFRSALLVLGAGFLFVYWQQAQN